MVSSYEIDLNTGGAGEFENVEEKRILLESILGKPGCQEFVGISRESEWAKFERFLELISSFKINLSYGFSSFFVFFFESCVVKSWEYQVW